MTPPDYCLLWGHLWLPGWATICMPRGDWAAWVQALGAIGAIYAGARAIRWQVRRQQTLANAAALSADVRRLKEHVALVKFAEGKIDTVLLRASGDPASYRDYLRTQYAPDEWPLMLKTLQGVDLRDIPDPSFKFAFASAVGLFERAKGFMDYQQADTNVAGMMGAPDLSALTALRDRFRERRSEMDARIALLEQVASWSRTEPSALMRARFKLRWMASRRL